jgi:hypothetical protein
MAKVVKKEAKAFKKGDTVKFKITTYYGTAKGTGKVIRLVPKDAGKGGHRLTVKDAKTGREYRPYPTQCTSA